jgi:hypothetical protein
MWLRNTSKSLLVILGLQWIRRACTVLRGFRYTWQTYDLGCANIKISVLHIGLLTFLLFSDAWFVYDMTGIPVIFPLFGGMMLANGSPVIFSLFSNHKAHRWLTVHWCSCCSLTRHFHVWLLLLHWRANFNISLKRMLIMQWLHVSMHFMVLFTVNFLHQSSKFQSFQVIYLCRYKSYLNVSKTEYKFFRSSEMVPNKKKKTISRFNFNKQFKL